MHIHIFMKKLSSIFLSKKKKVNSWPPQTVSDLISMKWASGIYFQVSPSSFQTGDLKIKF